MFSLYRSALRLALTLGEPQEELTLQAKEAINSANKVEAKKVVRSLPISEGGRKLIRYLRRVPHKSALLVRWAQQGFDEHGHVNLYHTRGLVSRMLSL